MLQSEAEILKKIGRRFPTERTHRKVVILLLTNRQLTLEITQRIKMMRGVKLLVIPTVGTLHFAVVARRIRTNFLVGDMVLLGLLKIPEMWYN